MKYSNEPGKMHPEAQRVYDLWENAKKEFKRMREEEMKELIRELCSLRFTQGATEASAKMKWLERLTIKKEIERLSQDIKKSMASIKKSRNETRKLNKRLEDLADYNREAVETLEKTVKRTGEIYAELFPCEEERK